MGAGLLVSAFLVGVSLLGTPAEAQQAVSDGTSSVTAESRKPEQADNTPFSGSFTQSFAIDVPAYHGLEPHLKLVYDSSAGWRAGEEDAGFIGVGWRLAGLPDIVRVSHGSGTPRMDGTGVSDTSDVFLYNDSELTRCVSGSPSPSCATGGTHQSRYESFERIVYNAGTNQWTVWSTNGTQSVFSAVGVWQTGNDGSPPAVGTSVRWRLASVTDTHGNQVTYSYSCAVLPACWPSQISYNGTVISFKTGANPRPIFHATGQSIVQLDRQLQTIDITSFGVRFRAYQLIHAISPATSLPLLTVFTEFGLDATLDPTTGVVTGGTQLEPNTFSYSGSAPALVSKNSLLYQLGPTGSQVAGTGYLSTNGIFGAGVQETLAFGRAVVQNCEDASNNGTLCSDSPNFMAVGHFAASENQDQLLFGTESYSGPNNNIVRENYGFANSNVGCPLIQGAPMVYTQALLADPRGDGTIGFLYPPSLGDIILGCANTTSVGAAAAGVDSTYAPIVGDFDGDGMDDIAYVKFLGQNTTTHTAAYQVILMRSTGTGFTAAVNQTVTVASFSDGVGPDVIAADIDGTGKAVLVFADGFQTAGFAGLQMVRFTGTGFSAPFAVPGPTPKYCGPYSPDTALHCIGAVDLDGAGLADIALKSTYAPGAILAGTQYLMNQGGQFSLLTTSPVGGGNFSIFGDVDGDGRTEIAELFSGPTYSPQAIAGIGGAFPDLLTTVVDANNLTTTIGYTSSMAWPNLMLRQARQTVTSITQTDGRNPTATTTYTYAGGFYDYLERRFLGFSTVKETLPCVSNETSCPTRTYTLRQDRASAGRIAEVVTRTGSGTVLRDEARAYAITTSAPYLAFETNRTVTETIGGASLATSIDHQYDQYGNVTQEIDHGLTSTSADDKYTVTTYAPNTSAYIVDAKAEQQVFGPAGTGSTALATTTTYYDGAGSYLTPPTKGDVTAVHRYWDTIGADVVHTATYDAFGNKTSDTDENGNTTTYYWDATYHLFQTEKVTPASAVNIQLITVTAWDPICQKPISKIDPNGQVTTYQYELFCREMLQVRPGGDYDYTIYYYNNYLNNTIIYRPPPQGQPSGFLYDTIQYDGHLRAITRVRYGTPGQGLISSNVSYTPRGSIATSAAPYYWPSDPAYNQTTAYDDLDRPISITEADGAVTTISYGLSSEPTGFHMVTTTDPTGRVTVVHSDARGNVIRKD